MEDTWDKDIESMITAETVRIGGERWCKTNYEGAFGQIFLSKDGKAMKKFQTEDKDKFLHEVSILEKIQNDWRQGFVQYLYSITTPNFCIIFEHLEITLIDYVFQNTFSSKEKDHICASVLFSISNALMFLHERKRLFHMDIKGNNIMRRGDQWVLIDFGSCIPTDTPKEAIVRCKDFAENIIGTFCLQPREALLMVLNWYKCRKPKKDLYLDTSLDTYCLASTLCVMISGKYPNGLFDSDVRHIPEILNNISKREWERDEALKKSSLFPLLSQMLHIDQKKRPWTSQVVFELSNKIKLN